MSERAKMSRAVRTARGIFGAVTVTLLAAASHAMADGELTPLAVCATAVLALPLCVLLAGKMGSLWRLTLAVVPAQFAYHWSFAGLGTVASPGSADAGLAVSPHAAHLGLLPASLSSEILASGAADATMWAAHALAAIATIALLHRGEHAALHLLHVLRSASAVALPRAVCLPVRPAIHSYFAVPVRPAQHVFLSAISYRGPPSAACAH